MFICSLSKKSLADNFCVILRRTSFIIPEGDADKLSFKNKKGSCVLDDKLNERIEQRNNQNFFPFNITN